MSKAQLRVTVNEWSLIAVPPWLVRVVSWSPTRTFCIMWAMKNIGDIAQFGPSDGLTPLQMQKLNHNFSVISRPLPSDSIVEIQSVETLAPGQSAYVEDVGYPPVAMLRFGIPQGEQGEQGPPGVPGGWDHDDILWVIENNTVGEVMKKTNVSGYHDLVVRCVGEDGNPCFTPLCIIPEDTYQNYTANGKTFKMKIATNDNNRLWWVVPNGTWELWLR